MQIKLDEIKIGKRIRQNYGDINSLADSLQRHGQIQPIIIDAEGHLVAGGRRLEAAKELGWETIWAESKESLDDVSRRELELEENIRRKEFDWPEEVLGLAHLYKLRQKRFGKASVGRPSATGESGYSLRNAADEFDRSRSMLSLELELAEGLKEFPQLFDEKTKTAAFRRLRVLREKALRTEIASRTRAPEALVAQPLESDESPPQAARHAGFKGHGIIYFGDCRQVLKALPEASVDCIITDPPFALGMFAEGETTSNTRLANAAGGMYDDDPHKILNMLDVACAELSRILRPDGHAYMFFHMSRYKDLITILNRHFGSAVEPVPILWIKNTSGIGDPNKTWVYAYEPFFFINRGRILAKPQAFNYIQVPTVPPRQKTHPTEKPTALLRHIVAASALRGEVVLDPFAGSGSTLIAAAENDCRFIGIEAEESYYTRIVDRMALALGGQHASEA